LKFQSKLNQKTKILFLMGILNIAAICFYFSISIQFNYFENFEKTFWSSPMTSAYIRVGDFLWNGLKGRAPHGSNYRTILYPMILGMFRHISGVASLEQQEKDLLNDIDSLKETKRANSGDLKSGSKYEKPEAIEDLSLLRKRADALEKVILSKNKKIAYVLWFIQFLFWLGSLNFILMSIRHLTYQKLHLVLSFIIFVSSISIIVLTFRAITESMGIFLISLWVYLFIKFKLDNISHTQIFLLTFILSLLTILKPIFQIQLAIYLIYIAYHHYRKPKTIAIVIIAISPVLLQLLFMAEFHGVLSLSKIGDITFKRYLAAKVYAISQYNSVQNQYIYEARNWTHDKSYFDILKFFIQHPRPTAIAFSQNVITENLLAASQYAGSLNGITQTLNTIYFCLHFLFFPTTLYVIFHSPQDTKLKISYLYLWFIFIVLSSGISFWVGDRLWIPTLPLWLIVYVWVYSHIVSNTKHEQDYSFRMMPIGEQYALFGSIISLVLSIVLLVLKRIPNLTSY